MSRPGPAVAIVIVSFEGAAVVPRTLAALDGQLLEGDELIVVDNASRDGTAEAAGAATPRARVLRQERNLGFAEGCNVGAAAAAAPLVLFLNQDALVAPGCLDALRAAAAERPGWGAWQALVTLDGGREINTAGGVTYFLGVGWAGRCGEPLASAPAGPQEVGFASGAALMVRREAWEATGGFDGRYFMYGEDLDLALRMRLGGFGVGVVPAARVEHDYEFDKGGYKWRLLERNRWWTLLSDYPAPLLVLIAPALAAFELAVLAAALRGGWLRHKLAAQLTVVRELGAILRRRRTVQGSRAIGAAEFAEHLSADVDSAYLGGAARVRPLVSLQRLYWTAVRRLLAMRRVGSSS